METNTYQLSADEIAAHVRDVVQMLRKRGVSAAEAAEQIGVTMRTLKAYWSIGGNHRGIQARHLDLLRDLAVLGYWDEVRRTPEFAGFWTVWYCQRGPYETDPYFRGKTFADHTHHIRAIELADTRVGRVILYGGNHPRPRDPFDSAPPDLEGDALLRHRLRVVRYTIECSVRYDGGDPEWRLMQLSDALGVSRHVLWQLHTEYAPWRLPLTEAMVVKAEAFLDANFVAENEVAA